MKKSSIIPIFTLLLCFLPASDASAQSFLKKVGKAVDKFLEVPAETEEKDSNTGNTSSSSKAKSQKKVYSYDELEQIYIAPHITSNTKKINLENGSKLPYQAHTYTDLHDSIFWHSSTFGKSWAPFDKNGEPIMKGYTHPTNKIPYFKNGVTILPYKGESCLVNKEGTILRQIPVYGYSFFNNRGIALALTKQKKAGRSGVHSSDYDVFAVFVDTEGEIVFNPGNKLAGTYDVQDTRYFSDSLMAYYDYANRVWGFIDTDLKVRVKPQYSAVHDFKEGYAAVKDSKGNWGFINTQGETVIPHKFTYEPSDFSGGYAVACKKDGHYPYVFINQQGEVVFDEMEKASPFQEGYANISKTHQNYGILNMLVDKNFKIAHVFTRDAYAVKLGNNYYTSKGIQYSISGVDTPFSEGLAKFSYEDPKTQKWLHGFVNEKGEITILFERSEF